MRGVRWADGWALAPILAVALLSGCGSTTKTVSVANAPTPAPTTTSAGADTSTSATTTSSTSTAPDAATGGTSPSRTAGAPAFVPQPATANQTVTLAADLVKAHGYTPNDVSQYHPNQTLQVLVGTHSHSGDSYGQQAFFFVDGRYIGTDAAQPSAVLHVVSQSDTQVILGYPLYREHDALCCPSGGEAKVTFQLNNGRLTPLQTIPPVNSATGLSRQ